MKKALKFAAMLLATAMVFASCIKDPQNDDNGGGDNGGETPTPTGTTYSVSFKPNGGGGTMQRQTFAEGETKPLTANAFTYEHHTFLHWNTAANGSGIQYDDKQEVTLTRNLILYAQWQGIPCTVTFDPNGGTGEMTPQVFCVGEQQKLKANEFSFDNHWFYGWNTSPDGSGLAYANSAQATFLEDVVLYAQWKAYKGELNGREWVDLGLPSGTLWATCNIGADSPTAFGDYFAWAETSPQASNAYSWETYKYANGDRLRLTKYCNMSSTGDNGFTDELIKLEPSDDAAAVNWGDGWRMPTTAEAFELRECCSYAWTTQNGVKGRLIVGPNGNSFFLPAAGSINNGNYNQVGNSCYCWTSELCLDYPSDAWALYFFPDSFGKNFFGRDNGYSIRPVCSRY